MTKRLLKHALAAGFIFATAEALAQTMPADIIDSQKPPTGFAAPKASEARDLSMAKYAQESFLDGEEGVVALRILVRTNGSVGDSQLVESSGSAHLDRYAQDLVKDWRYQPATVAGTAVDAWIPVNIVWALQTLRFELLPAQAKNLPSYYPRDAARRGEQGVSNVRFLVAPSGKVTKAVIDRPSGHPQLDDAALKMIATAWTFNPTTVPNQKIAGAWFRVAIVWGIEGQSQRASSACGETGQDDSIAGCTRFLMNTDLTSYQRANAYQARGDAYAENGEFDKAIADYSAGIKRSPSVASLFINRAKAHMDKGEKEQAFVDLDTAVDVEPLSYQSYLARAEAYFTAGDRAKAIRDFSAVTQIAPQNELSEAYTERCHVLAQLGQAQAGLPDCDKSVSLTPKSSSVFDSRGYAYFKLGQYPLAIRDFDAAIKINSRLATALYGRGVVKLKMGDPKGQADIDAAKTMAPTIGARMAKLGLQP